MGQNTVVTALITDPSGNPYKNCSFDVSLVNLTGSGTLVNISGSTFQTQYNGGSCDSTGTLVQPLFDSTVISPAGTQWKFNICDITGKTCFNYTTPACPTAGCITGSTINISAAISAVAPSLSIAGNAGVGLNNVFTGTNTFQGAASFKQRDNVIDAFGFTGAGANDMCNKIVAAGAALISGVNGPGLIDATGFTGTQACSVDPLGGLNPYTMLLLGNVTINSTVQWNIQKNGIGIIGFGPSQTRIIYTGTGAVSSLIKLSSPANPTGYYNAVLSKFSAAGNTHNTSVIDAFNYHKIKLDHVSLWGATTQCAYIEASILSTFDNLECDVADTNSASLGLPNLQVPTNGVVMNSGVYNSVTVQTTAGTVKDINVHGVGSGKGIWLQSASSMTFTSGTSEGNIGCGLQIDINSAQNTIIGMDLESNSATCDVLDNGTNTKLIGIIGITATPAIQLGATSKYAVLDGGNLSNVTINAAALFPRWTDGSRIRQVAPWTNADNSGQLSWNDLGQGELNVSNNTFTGVANYAVRFRTANAAQTAFNELGGFTQDGQWKLRSSTGVYATANGGFFGWNNAGQAEADYSTNVFTSVNNYAHLFNVPNAGNTAWVQAGGFLQSGIFQAKQVLASTGVACTNGELVLNAGWGTTATVTNVVGTGQTCSWTITSSGTGQAANPIVTDNLTNALPTGTIVCEMNMHGGTGANTLFQQTVVSAIAPQFTFNGTPVAGLTYIVTRRCGP